MKKGTKHSKETMEKFKKAVAMRSQKHYQNRKPHSKESHEKQSMTMKSLYPAGKTHFNYGSKRTLETREKMRQAKLGKFEGAKNTRWKGGKYRHPKGYIMILASCHPFCDSRGYIFEHRLVIEKLIGRFLKPWPEEVCHHINKRKADNRSGNLMAFVSIDAHNKFENGIEIPASDIIFDGRKL